jgi:hypothetical protein
MIAPTNDRSGRCPFMRPEGASSARAKTTALYCGLPGGRVRVPEPAEIARYCAAGEFEGCPTYERALARERALESLL